jgi:hypothetical protein
MSLRDNEASCSLHIALDPGSGENGKPVSGSFHHDAVNPFYQNDAVPTEVKMDGGVLRIVEHGIEDVIPDFIIGVKNNPLVKGACYR